MFPESTTTNTTTAIMTASVAPRTVLPASGVRGRRLSSRRLLEVMEAASRIVQEAAHDEEHDNDNIVMSP